MNCSEFLLRLSKGDFPTAVSVYGDDGYWKKKAIDAITASCDPFDLNVLDKAEPSDVIFDLNTIPLLSERRVVWLKSELKLNKKNAASFEDYLKNPNSTSILLLDYEFDNEFVTKVDCGKAANSDAVRTETEKILSDAGKTVSKEVVSRLIEYCDSNMSNVYSECQKLSAYSDGEITEKDLDECVEPDVNYKSYNLVNFILKGDYVSCYDCFAKFPDKFTSILGSLIGAYRCAFYSKGQNMNVLQRTLDLKYSAVKTAKAVADKYTASQLYSLLLLFYDLEYKLKTGRIATELAFPLMISEAIERRTK